MSALNKSQLRYLYGKRAGNYDITANAYYLIGFRENVYRKKAVERLRLRRGDTVVDLCCGTGLNFRYLVDAVGPEGAIIGVDMTAEMLRKAVVRVKKNGWRNVEIVQSDGAAYVFPKKVDGVLSTFAITLIPEYDAIIGRAAAALGRDGRCVILDFKIPANGWAVLAPVAILITRPFGVTLDLSERHPWESVSRYFQNVTLEELYGGFGYISTGGR